MRMLAPVAIAAICLTLFATAYASAAPANVVVIGRAAAESSPSIDVACAWRSVRVCGNHGCRYHRRWVCW